jgi:hypothetical protein
LLLLYQLEHYEDSSPDEVAGISQIIVLDDGSLYRARFSLVNNNSEVVTSDANITFTVTPTTYISTPQQQNQTLYQRQFAIRAEDFQQYQLVLTGQPITVYAWQIDRNSLLPPYTDSSYPKVALLNVTLPNNKTFTAESSSFF